MNKARRIFAAGLFIVPATLPLHRGSMLALLLPTDVQVITPALVVVALSGGAVGSYAGVVAARGFRQSFFGRSRCDNCGRSLHWYELVPVVSYISLRRRCRSCKATIAWQIFLWELGGAITALAIAAPLLLGGVGPF